MGTQTPVELPESGDNESVVQEDNWEESWWASSDMDDTTIAAVRI
jgi:hypothetical protein